MSDVGFWKIAAEAPSWLAVVEPDGTEVSAGELLANANQLVHGLRALGLEKGDCIATVLDNGAAMLEAFLSAHQAGWYVTPINWHLTAPEIAYILEDSDAAAVITSPRVGEAVGPACDSIDFPTAARFVDRGELPGFRGLAEIKRGQATTAPSGRSAGASMTYTSGTTGKPKGVRRPLTGAPPETMATQQALF